MVGTHLLPPNLLKLFRANPPLPYLKPTGRDIDLPLKSRSKQPHTLSVSETLKRLKEEKEEAEAKAIEAGKLEGNDEVKVGEDDEESAEFKLIGEEARVVRREERRRKREEVLEKGMKECKEPRFSLHANEINAVVLT